MRIAQRPAQQLDADSLFVRFGAAVALFNGGEIKRDVGGWCLLVIEILRDLLANAAGVVTDLCVNLLIGLGYPSFIPGSNTIGQDRICLV